MRPVLGIFVSDPDLIAVVALAVSVMLGVPAWSSFLQRKRSAGSLVEMSERLLEHVESELSGVRGTVATSMSASDAHAEDDDRRFGELEERVDRMADLLDGFAEELHRVSEQVAGCGRQS